MLIRAVLARHAQGLLRTGFFGILGLFAVWPLLPLPQRASEQRTIVVYGFSILGDVMTDAIFPAFQEEWQARTGERVEFISSFGGSGTITNQLIMGVPASVALLALDSDARRLSDAGVIPPQSWELLPHRGVVNRTPFVILVRPGNPNRIQDFDDLARPGVGVVHPDPLTSGGANWALIAEYGAGLRKHPDQPEAGHELLRGIWGNIVAQPSSAQAARSQFESGFGDALITYEQEAVSARALGKLKLDVVYPPSTVLSEHTAVVIDRNVAPDDREVVHAFVDFLWSERAQNLFVQHGFRSVDDSLNSANPWFGNITDPFGIDEFGGWVQAKRQIVDAVWKNQVLQEVSR